MIGHWLRPCKWEVCLPQHTRFKLLSCQLLQSQFEQKYWNSTNELKINWDDIRLLKKLNVFANLLCSSRLDSNSNLVNRQLLHTPLSSRYWNRPEKSHDQLCSSQTKFTSFTVHSAVIGSLHNLTKCCI